MSGVGAMVPGVLITDELARRPGTRDPAREVETLCRLARALADDSETALDVVARCALEMCEAGSAGITIEDAIPGGPLRWVAVTGALAPHVGQRFERGGVSAAVVFEAGAVHLLRDPAREFPAFATVSPRIAEHLLVPIRAAGSMLGALWVAAHDDKRFTAADAERLESFAGFAAAALRARAASRAARAGERMLATMAEHAPVGIYLCAAPSGTIRFFNRRAAELWGREPRLDDINDRFCGSLKMYRPDGSWLPHEECPMAQALAGHAQRNMEVQIERPDGSRAWALVNTAPVHDDDGRLIAAVSAFADITALKDAEQALRQRESELDDFFEQGLVGLHWVGPDGTILRANRAELDMLGYARDEYVGHPISDFHVDQETIDDILRRLRAGEAIHNRPARLRTKDGSIRHVLISSNVLRRNGSFVHTRCFTRDVTELREAEAEREALLAREQAARAAAEAATRAKDEFLAMLGHELRNPLGVITSALGVLDRVGSPETTAVNARSAIRRHSSHLAALVDDLLDVARVTLGKIVLKRARTDLGHAVMRWLGTYRTTAGAADRHLDADVETVWVDADETRLEQILSNLVGNAVKFSRGGGRVRLAVRRVGDEAVLDVVDDGVGISAELLPRVFELFAQGERTLDRSEGGLGLGLTLVRHLVDLHGGRVEAASDGPGTGARFTVRLPLATAAVDTPPASSPSARPSRRRVLIVEDNDDARDMLRVLLELDGHSVCAAADGPRALDLAASQAPEIVILDVGLPGMSGYDVARRLRANANGRPIRLLALTGYGQPEDRHRALDAGFDGHLVKPVNPDLLRRELAS